MKLGIALLFLVSVSAAFVAGWALGRSQAPVVERPSPAPHAATPAAQTPAAATTHTAETTTLAVPAPAVAAPAPAVPQPVAPSDGKSIVQAIRDAWAKGDKGAAAKLGDELKKWVGDDPSRALEVVALMNDETNPELIGGLFDFLSAKFITDPAVRAKVLEIAMNHPDPAHQARALDFLRKAVEKDPAFADSIPQATVQQVMALLRNSSSDDVRAQSARLLGRFLGRPGVWDAMKEVALNFRESSEGAREAAIEALRSGQDPSALGVIIDVLKGDPSDKIRRKAAESLAILAPNQQKAEVLREVEGILGNEKSWDVKGMLVWSLIRVAPDETVGVLQRSSARESDPKAKARMEAAASVLQTGERDWLKAFMKYQELEKRLEAQGR